MRAGKANGGTPGCMHTGGTPARAIAGRAREAEDRAMLTLLWIIIAVAVLVAWLLGIVDIFRRHLDAKHTVAWLLLVLILPILGTILYWVLRPPDPGTSSAPRPRSATAGTSGRTSRSTAPASASEARVSSAGRQAEAAPAASAPMAWLPIAILAAAQFVMVLDSSVMNVSISQIVADLDTTIQGVQLAITAYTLVMAALMLAGAKLGDIIGRERTFAIGLAVYGTGSLITSLSPNLGVLLFGWSLIEGIGAAMVMPAIVSLVAGIYSGSSGRSRSGSSAGWPARRSPPVR